MKILIAIAIFFSTYSVQASRSKWVNDFTKKFVLNGRFLPLDEIKKAGIPSGVFVEFPKDVQQAMLDLLGDPKKSILVLVDIHEKGEVSFPAQAALRGLGLHRASSDSAIWLEALQGEVYYPRKLIKTALSIEKQIVENGGEKFPYAMRMVQEFVRTQTKGVLGTENSVTFWVRNYAIEATGKSDALNYQRGLKLVFSDPYLNINTIGDQGAIVHRMKLILRESYKPVMLRYNNFLDNPYFALNWWRSHGEGGARALFEAVENLRIFANKPNNPDPLVELFEASKMDEDFAADLADALSPFE